MPLRLALLALSLFMPLAATAAEPAPTAAELAGTWVGTMTHDGETQAIALGLSPDTSGRLAVALSIPVIHLDHAPIGSAPLVVEGDSIRIGPFRFRYDGAAHSLSGVMPRALVPVYAIPVRLQRTESFAMPPRAELAAPEARPLWQHALGSAVWAGATYADGGVYVGSQDGRVVALDARSGAERWVFQAGGPIRSRPAVGAGAVYVQADDGQLYKLHAATGRLAWRVKTVGVPIERLPFDNPRSRFDRFGSDVAIAGGRLYVGTHDGNLIALDARTGRRAWEFHTGDAILSAPVLAGGRVFVGSFDHFVYALDARTGRLMWKRDTQGAVVSTPAIHGDRVIVGNRAYDLLGLDVRTGAVAWKRYIWSSWVESSASVRDGVVYVGSSDAAAVFACDAETGRPVWTSDVHGWAWGQPAVTGQRVYVGTASQVGYPAQHAGGVLALDRATGAAVWRHAAAAPDSGAYGFPGSPALGGGHVFVTGLDGVVRAFAE
jgi:outer membrane protein assembly factor BamB